MGMKHVIVLISSSLTTRELGIFSYAYWLLKHPLQIIVCIFSHFYWVVCVLCLFISLFSFFFFILDTNIWSIVDIFEKSFPKEAYILILVLMTIVVKNFYILFWPNLSIISPRYAVWLLLS